MGLLFSVGPGAAVASAQPSVHLELGADVALAVTEPYVRRFGPGADLHGGLALVLAPAVAATLRLEGGLLSDGPAPTENGVRDPGVAGWGALLLGLRLRPLEPAGIATERLGTGLRLDVSAGLVLTGGFARPAFGGELGWGIAVGDVVLAPSVSVLHTLHWDDALGAGDDVIVRAGLTLVLLDGPPAVATEVAAEVEEPETEVPATCPEGPEDQDGWQDEDGCADLDDDADGIPDATDACPRAPEDFDGEEDEDGCPEEPRDRDHDGFLDADDACPDEPEVVNGVQDDDGCPDEGLIELIGDRVILEEIVLFDINRARVHMAARPVLAALVTLFLAHPEWGVMSVEGHADARGEPSWNDELSLMRAQHVRDVLVELGLPTERIEVIGHGARRPRVEGEDERAYAANRRVEFVMIPHGRPESDVPLGAAAVGDARSEGDAP